MKPKKDPRKKDYSPDAVARRQWRKENLNTDPYAVTPDTPEGRERIQRGNTLTEQWVNWAKDYGTSYYLRHPSIPEDDFHGAAFLGMTEASRLYEPKHGGFGGFATWHMRKAIQKLLSSSAKMTCRPRNWRTSIQKLYAEMEMMAHEGLTPTFDAACDRMGVGEKQRGALRDMYDIRSRETIPLEYATITDEHWSSLESMVDTEEFHQMREAMKKLPGIYVCILIDTFNQVPMKELARKYGLSEPTVLRYKRRGVDWLRFFMGTGPRPPHEITVKSGTMVPLCEGKDSG